MITHPFKSPADIILQQVHFILGKPYSINKGNFMTLWATIRVDQPLYKTREFVDSSDWVHFDKVYLSEWFRHASTTECHVSIDKGKEIHPHSAGPLYWRMTAQTFRKQGNIHLIFSWSLKELFCHSLLRTILVYLMYKVVYWRENILASKQFLNDCPISCELGHLCHYNNTSYDPQTGRDKHVLIAWSVFLKKKKFSQENQTLLSADACTT